MYLIRILISEGSFTDFNVEWKAKENAIDEMGIKIELL